MKIILNKVTPRHRRSSTHVPKRPPMINGKSQNNSRQAVIRRVRCRQCEPCTREDCQYCSYCADMKKYGGAGKLKQSCLSRKCISPMLPKHVTCSICSCKKGIYQDKTLYVKPTLMKIWGQNLEPSDLYECVTCSDIVHPLCLFDIIKIQNNQKFPILNDDLPNSWECAICTNRIPRYFYF